MKKNPTYRLILIWALASVVTLGAIAYQKLTGPTYPKREKVSINNKEYKLKFLRSHGGDDNAKIELDIDDAETNAKIFYKNYPEEKDKDWIVVDFVSSKKEDKNILVAELPHQKPAGKLMYFVEISNNSDVKLFFKEKPIIIRFKGDVPAWILVPHIIFMFFGMLIANAAGLFAVFNMSQFKLYTTITLILLFLGGMVLGPIVQKFAFLEYWAGVPFGWDLTDNKLLVAFIAWIVAFIANRKVERRYFTIAAAIITVIIFSIPHSMHGSELDRATGDITQGLILLF